MHETEANGLRALLEKHHRDLREVLDRRHDTLYDELAPLIDSSAQTAAARERTRTTESLTQALRRIRQAASQADVLRVLADTASSTASKPVVVVVEGGHVRVSGESNEIDLADAPALRSVIESKDPFVTLPTGAELGEAIAALSGGSGDKAYLFPVAVRQEVSAILIVAGDAAPPSPELLCEAAGMKLETLTAPARPEAALVRIVTPPIPASETSGPRAWDDLNAEDQRLHLQAQRVARVKVAQMRLEHPNAVRNGSFSGNIYGALREQIDAARGEFLQAFLAKSATMVDYLHLEIMRSLAHDDDRLLGKEYPGPMV